MYKQLLLFFISLLLLSCLPTPLPPIVETTPTVINIPGKSESSAKQIIIPDEPVDHQWNIYIISSVIGSFSEVAVFESKLIDDAKFNEEVPLKYLDPWECSFQKARFTDNAQQVVIYCRSEIDDTYRSINTNAVICNGNAIQSSDYNFQIEKYTLLIHLSCASTPSVKTQVE